MSRCVYVNGRWLNYDMARIHVEDRGFQFADGVYETCAVRDEVIIDVRPHLDRLAHSLSEIKMDWPVAKTAMPHLMNETRRRNYVAHGFIYVQITRGQARRDHIFPQPARSSLIIIARHVPRSAIKKRQQGISVITKPDQRWQRCDIKSTGLLANVLARQAAYEEGAQEAWLVNEEGIITEGSASNAWIFHHGALITHRACAAILDGITRHAVMDIAHNLAIPIDETGFTRQQALEADEAFVTSSAGGIIAVLRLDGQKIGAFADRAGVMTQKIQAAFEEKISQQIIK